jgi:RHS repeat-associated protein
MRGVVGIERVECRYGFQGQEKDDEVKGEGNSINYKYRMHDPRVGRFFAVDPLAKKYPHNGPYNFSENIVLHAVELEGLEAFFIHGTESNRKRWTESGKTLVEGITSRSRSSTYNDDFSWADDVVTTEVQQGKYTTHTITRSRKRNYLHNDENDRAIAAKKLVSHVLDNQKEGETATLIGHSHGGNVAIQAASILQEKNGIVADVITIATPAYNDSDSKENASKLKGVHLHIYNSIDGVDFWAGGTEEYSNGKTHNVEVDASSKYSSYEWMDSHSFDSDYQKEFPDALDKAIEGTSLEKGIKQNMETK